jgi:hypothetical protein
VRNTGRSSIHRAAFARFSSTLSQRTSRMVPTTRPTTTAKASSARSLLCRTASMFFDAK